tara:strand:+ start:6990 stop:7487 length:498 start_codon:yes stop_codon:yes gene_type:complete
MIDRKELSKLITYNITDYNNIIPNKGSILCLDIGSKTIGLSICNSDRSIASNLQTIIRTKFNNDIRIIKKIILDYQVKSMVVGLPLDLNGKLNKKSQSVIRLTKEININIKLPVLLKDERNSTNAVTKFFINEIGLSRNKRKKVIDSSAAAWVLEGVIKSLNNIN